MGRVLALLWLHSLPIEGAPTDRNEAVENIENNMACECDDEAREQIENAKSTGQRRGWKNKKHLKLGLIVLILYNDS